ncbi:oxidoreductase [Exophiala viscosa]|uniref:Oxidoreductase n=1 Tax=Exophiala viscosa TaxID=2486360 RepID=A0AAN6E1S4_9EURO|nr:oxidoreductase [Exophiala viscosa]KAI1621802.1 oxidoreductase [Exophiala viscosa]
MRVFVTGAAGWVGSAVTKELIQHGHQVLGLARSDATAEAITKAGGEVLRGDLEDLESLKKGAQDTDGTLHLAFIHDFTNMAHATAVDRAAISALAEVVAGTGKPVIITSGSLIVADLGGDVADEDTDIDRSVPWSDRWKSEDLILSLSKEKDVKGMIVRLTPTVHGDGDKGFIPGLIAAARKNGAAIYVGDGSAKWPAVHRYDAAALYRLALEKGKAGGIYHASAEQGIAQKDIQGLIGKVLNLPVESKPMQEGLPKLGFFAHVTSMDKPLSSEKTQKELGWHPKEPGLLADMEAHYFKDTAQSKYQF